MKQIIIALFIALSIQGFSQTHDYSRNRCLEYHKNHCDRAENKYYQINSESRSGLFHKGQKSRTLIEAFNGRDYRVSLCHDDVFNKPVIFRIIDKSRDEVLYDNTEDNFAQDFEFTVTSTVELWVEVEVQGESSLVTTSHNAIIRRDSEVGCIGLLIEFMVTPRKGF
jgi:hypothetical protein